MAQKHNVSIATILISWLVGRDIVALPKSVTPSRQFSPLFRHGKITQAIGIESNLITISLPKEDIAAIDAIAEGGKGQRVNTPNWLTDFVRT